MLPLSKTLLLKNRFAVFLLAITTTLIYYYGLSTANNRSMNENSKEEENAVNVIDIKTEELEFKEADDQTSLKELFDQKRKSIQPNDMDCFCPNGRNNWIHFTGCPGSVDNNAGAGIKDRENILRNLMWYADELCANIALSCSPEVWLSQKHGCYAPHSATWDAYFTPVRNSEDTIKKKANILFWDIDAESTFEGLQVIDDQTAGIAAYEEGRQLHSEGTPFVWNFYRDFWGTNLYTKDHIWPNQNLNHREYTDTCGILDLDTSEELLNIGELALQEMNIKYSNEFVTLHLRRGDAMESCNTRPDTVREYLKCSIGTDDVRKVIVLTNGKKWYTENLMSMFSAEFPDKEMILLDEFIESESFVEKLNKSNILSSHTGKKFLNDNCFVFSAEKVLISMSRYHLERGRMHCESCDRGGSINSNGSALNRSLRNLED
mmetsp:Transcript_27716/g.42458  ORF Transcript_27716/g.42458 Transcript_27716/m.42458 type:complete len:434 (+) Transcript_27716:63-1364(+)